MINIEVVQSGYWWNVTRDAVGKPCEYRIRRIADSPEGWLVFNEYGQAMNIFHPPVAELIEAVKESEKSVPEGRNHG